MPEGPQMMFLKEQAEHFIGQKIVSADGNAKDIDFGAIKGKHLVDIRTFGKEILFCFPGFTIRIHLMLFGKYAIDSELNRLLRLGLHFENGEINFYATECRFITEPLEEVYDFSADVMNKKFDKKKALDKLLTKPNQLICEALLDQHTLAGVGNKIKNEVLFRRRVHPESTVGQIPKTELKKLIDECVKLSFEYLEWKHEETDNDNWEAYKKNECPRDHIPIIRQKIGKSKRTCYFCDKCQRLYVEEE